MKTFDFHASPPSRTRWLRELLFALRYSWRAGRDRFYQLRSLQRQANDTF